MEQWDKREEKGHRPNPKGLSQIPSPKVSMCSALWLPYREKTQGGRVGRLDIQRQVKRLLGEFREDMYLPGHECWLRSI